MNTISLITIQVCLYLGTNMATASELYLQLLIGPDDHEIGLFLLCIHGIIHSIHLGVFPQPVLKVRAVISHMLALQFSW